MERYPGIKTLTSAFGAEKAKAIRAIFGSADAYLEPSYRKLEAIDSILGTHGVERIEEGHNSKSPPIIYCNTGDPYNVTIMLVGSSWRVGCWGDIVESDMNAYN